jgi:hypothetical protein
MTTLVELSQLLDTSPVIARINPVSLAYLDDVTVYPTLEALVLAYDTPDVGGPGRALTLDANPRYMHRFPHITCDHDPFTPSLNQVLFQRYDFVQTHMLAQAQVTERIVSESDGYDNVILLLIDGLSFADVRHWACRPATQSKGALTIEPCLAAAPTITEVGFRAIIGDSSLALRLFDRGYTDRLGFTYWEREDNRLTNTLFRTIQTEKVRYFSEILERLRQKSLKKTYVQILRSGLDSLAHGYRGRPPTEAVIEDIWTDFTALADVVAEKGIAARLYLISDHGLLWQHETQFVVSEEGGKVHPRYYAPGERGWHGMAVTFNGHQYHVLDYPQVRRELYSDEQGTHGGISFQEAIVPFVTLEVKPC